VFVGKGMRRWVQGARRCRKGFRRFDKDLQSKIHVFKMKKVQKNCSSCFVLMYIYTLGSFHGSEWEFSSQFEDKFRDTDAEEGRAKSAAFRERPPHCNILQCGAMLKCHSA